MVKLEIESEKVSYGAKVSKITDFIVIIKVYLNDLFNLKTV